jgi:hypothetical protein
LTTYTTDQGGELTPDEVEFGRAVEEYQRLRRRRYPQFSEILAIAVSLGYRKVAEKMPLPKAPGYYRDGQKKASRASHDWSRNWIGTGPWEG